MNPRATASAGFVARFGREPDGVVFAPGRVNLIGEHVDYNDGLVLPMPISVGTAIAWAATGDNRITAVALDLGDAEDSFGLGGPAPPSPPDWRAYVRGMATCGPERGVPAAGAQLAIAGSIPRGSGLSSSASLCIATGRALAAAAGGGVPDPRALALAAQDAEHRFAGVHCGIMDQMAIAAGEPGFALQLDCRDLSTRRVRLPAGWTVMIVQSGVSRGLVDGQYNQRRRDCETAAAAIGVASLRDATPEMLAAAAMDPVVRRRARHVIGEIGRTASAVEAIEGGDIGALGTLLAESHASLRDDFEVSVPAVDALVDCLSRAIGGVGGARMTGGGFGGAVVAVLLASDLDRVRDRVLAGYRQPDGSPPQIIIEAVPQESANAGGGHHPTD